MKKIPSSSYRNPVHLLALGFGSGAAPKAPGTFGTVVGVILYLPLSQLALPWYLAVVVVGAIAGIYICGKTSRDWGVHDHGAIVWDEIIGYWITMIAIPVTWYWILVGFLLFRLFDIWKPWPISVLDKRVGGGTGIMVDDILAGIISWVILMLLVSLV